MFQSVVEQKGWKSGRFGTGAGVSVLVHAAIVAAVFLVFTVALLGADLFNPIRLPS